MPSPCLPSAPLTSSPKVPHHDASWSWCLKTKAIVHVRKKTNLKQKHQSAATKELLPEEKQKKTKITNLPLWQWDNESRKAIPIGKKNKLLQKNAAPGRWIKNGKHTFVWHGILSSVVLVATCCLEKTVQKEEEGKTTINQGGKKKKKKNNSQLTYVNDVRKKTINLWEKEWGKQWSCVPPPCENQNQQPTCAKEERRRKIKLEDDETKKNNEPMLHPLDLLVF